MTWFVPAKGPVRDQLLATIARLAAEHDAHRFQPHLTLAPNFDSTADAADHALSSVIGDTPPVDVTFTAVGHEHGHRGGLAGRRRDGAPAAAATAAGP